MDIDQATIFLQCPAGCEHRVKISGHATAKEVTEQFKEQAGIMACVVADGSIAWKGHEVVTDDSVVVEKEDE